MEVVELGPADGRDVDLLGRVAFGATSRPASDPDWAGVRRFGVRDGRGRLVAKLTDRAQDHWLGGRRVAASGVAGVAVEPEHRGGGLALAMLARAHDAARERGAAISTLYRTAPALYRRAGYEQVAMRTTWTLPTAALARVRVPDGVVLQAAGAEDLGAMARVYDTVAAQGNAQLHREAPLWDWDEELTEADGVTLARDGSGEVVGYCAWKRGPGYDAAATVVAEDLFGLTAQATLALLASLGSWASVAGRVEVHLPAHDPLHLLLPTAGIAPLRADHLMLAVLDAPAAVAARGWTSTAAGSVDLELVDAPTPGCYRLVLDAGQGRLEPGGRGGTVLHGRGLSVLYAGHADPWVLRRAGLLSGGSPADDAFLAAAFAGPVPAVNDYF